MKRSTRVDHARQTVAIVEQGRYTSQSGHTVHLAEAVERCLAETRLFHPSEGKRLRNEAITSSSGTFSTIVEVVNETTLSGLFRLLDTGTGPVAVLNFASAKNPGGGFLNGSEAQEESLARSSALYASLLQAMLFYEDHRASSSLLYSDALILSPHCPVIRNDDGLLLDQPVLATFLTCAAPNAGAIVRQRPHEQASIVGTLRRRSELVLALAASQGYTRLILGAWGCGVFRNDPHEVASAFAEHLHGLWAGRFQHVVFSVLDTSAAQANYSAFDEALSRPSSCS